MIGRIAPFWLIVAAVVATIAVYLSFDATAASERRVVIEIREFEFIPERPVVDPGDIVVWKNLDIVPHTVTSKDGNWDSGLIEAGGTWVMLVTHDTGEAYYCRYHPSMVAALDIKLE